MWERECLSLSLFPLLASLSPSLFFWSLLSGCRLPSRLWLSFPPFLHDDDFPWNRREKKNSVPELKKSQLVTKNLQHFISPEVASEALLCFTRQTDEHIKQNLFLSDFYSPLLHFFKRTRGGEKGKFSISQTLKKKKEKNGRKIPRMLRNKR